MIEEVKNKIKWIELGTEGYPIPLWDAGGQRVVWYEEDPNNPDRNTIFLPTMKDVTKDQFYGEFMREVMCDPSLLPALTDMVNRVSKKTDTQRKGKSYNYTIMGDPGMGKTYVMSKLASLVHPRGAFKIECQNLKNPKELYQVTSVGDKSKRDVVDAYLRHRANEIKNAEDNDVASELFIPREIVAYMKKNLGNNAVTEEVRDDGRRVVAVDWHHPEISSRVNPKEVDLILDEIIKRLNIEYKESNDLLKMKEDDGPLIRALLDPNSPDYGRMVILDECNRIPETETWVTIQSFFSEQGGDILKLNGANDQERTLMRDNVPETFMFLGTGNPATEEMGISAQEMSKPVISRYGAGIDLVFCDAATREDYISRVLKHMTGVPAYFEYKYDPEYYDKHPEELAERLWAIRTIGLSKEEIKRIPAEEKYNIDHIDRTIEVARSMGSLFCEANILVQQAKKDTEVFTEEYLQYIGNVAFDLRYCRKVLQGADNLLEQPNTKDDNSARKGGRRAKIGGGNQKTQEEVVAEMNKRIAAREKGALFVRGKKLEDFIASRLYEVFMPGEVERAVDSVTGEKIEEFHVNSYYVEKAEEPDEVVSKMKEYLKKIEVIAKDLHFEFAGYEGDDSFAKLYNARKEDFIKDVNEKEYTEILTESINKLYRQNQNKFGVDDLFDGSTLMQVLNALASDKETRGIIVPSYQIDNLGDVAEKPFKETYVTSDPNVKYELSDLITSDHFIDSMIIPQCREHNISKLMEQKVSGSMDLELYPDDSQGIMAKAVDIANGENENIFTSVVSVNDKGENGLAAIVYNPKNKKCGIIANFNASESDFDRLKKQGVHFIDVGALATEVNNNVRNIDEIVNADERDKNIKSQSFISFIKQVVGNDNDIDEAAVISSFMLRLSPCYCEFEANQDSISAFCNYLSRDADMYEENEKFVVAMTNVDYKHDTTFEQAMLNKKMLGR